MLHRSKIAVTLLIVLVSIFPAGVFATPVAQQGNFKVSVASTATGSIPHEIPLKMTQIPGGQLSETTGFVINPENVVQLKQGENLIVTTSENLKVNNVKAKNVQGQQVDLMPLPNNMWSLLNLAPGNYLLDVIVDMSSSGILGVYETILVILVPGQPPLAPATVINQLSILIETEVIFDDGDNMTDDGDNIIDDGDNIIDDGDNIIDDGDNMTDPTPEPPCPPETQVNGVCPPTDDITPVPEPPTPECPEAGPEVCEQELPSPPEDEQIQGAIVMEMVMMMALVSMEMEKVMETKRVQMVE